VLVLITTFAISAHVTDALCEANAESGNSCTTLTCNADGATTEAPPAETTADAAGTTADAAETTEEPPAETTADAAAATTEDATTPTEAPPPTEMPPPPMTSTAAPTYPKMIAAIVMGGIGTMTVSLV
jgi:hypothetical protein